MPGSDGGAGVTIIVVAYNHGTYLPELLASIEAQEAPPQHVVLCDDHSSDASADVLREWSQRVSIPTHLALNETNMGLTATLNAALALVRTPYYAYISGDDVMSPTRLGRQVALIEETDAAMVYSDARVIDSQGRRQAPDFIEWYLGPGIDPDDRFEALLRIGNWIPAPSILLRTEVVRSLGGYDSSLFFEDFDLWLRIARRHEITHLREPLVSFRRLDDSLGSTKFADDNDDWQWAKVRIRSKHFGAGRESDRVIATVIRPWLVNLAARDHDRRTLARLFRRSAVAAPGRASLQWATLASIPGPWLSRAARRRRAGY